MTRAPRWTLAAGLAIVLVAWLGTLRLNLGYDEGVYSQTLRLLAAGHPLVSDVFTSQPPLWPYLALPGWLVGGVTATRLWIMAWGVLGLFATYRIGRIYASPTLAGIATILVAATPGYSSTTGSIEADVPALALAMCSLMLAMRPDRSPRPLLRQVAIGVLLGLALMVKLLVAPMIVVPVVAAIRLGITRREAVRMLVVFAISTSAVVVAVGAGFWDHGQLWQQAVGFHIASQTFIGGLKTNVSTALDAPGTCAFLLAGAYAATEIAHRRDPDRLLPVVWFAAIGVFLLVHVPLFTHHLVVAIPPAALLIVLALDKALTGHRLQFALAALVVVSLVGTVADGLDGPVRETARNDAAVAALRRLPANAVIVTDDQAAATAADRSVSGPLVDTSQVRISAGNLTPAQVCVQIGHADAVLLTRGGRFEALPTVAGCTRAMMALAWQDSTATLYVRHGVALAP